MRRVGADTRGAGATSSVRSQTSCADLRSTGLVSQVTRTWRPSDQRVATAGHHDSLRSDSTNRVITGVEPAGRAEIRAGCSSFSGWWGSTMVSICLRSVWVGRRRRVRRARVRGGLGRVDPKRGLRGSVRGQEHHRCAVRNLAAGPNKSQVDHRGEVGLRLVGARRTQWSTTAVADVRPSTVRSWVSNLTAQGVGAATIENALGLLRALTDMAVVERRIQASPVSGIKPPRRRHQARGYLTHAQVDALSRETRTQVIRRRGGSHVTADRPDHELIVLLLAYTGLRWGEMAALRVGSINLSRRRLDIYEAIAEVSGHRVLDSVKNHERRSVPFTDFLTAGLADLMGGTSLNDHIFTGSTGEPIRVSTFRPRAFAPAVERCRALDPLFPLITPHDLRHTAASLAISAGANPKGVQTMLGHASAAKWTLDTYADLFPDGLDAVAKGVERGSLANRIGQKLGKRPREPGRPGLRSSETGSDLR